MERFADDFDRGVTKYQMLEEAQEGWGRLNVEGSPTFVFPFGKQISNVGLPENHFFSLAANESGLDRLPASGPVDPDAGHLS